MKDPLGLVGSVIENRYKIEALVGEGGSAFVYRATHAQAGTPVAVKFLHSFGLEDEAAREAMLADFLQEGRLIAELSARSAAIVQARDVGVLRQTQRAALPYLVLEWLPGRTLDEVIVAETNAGHPPRNLAEAVALLEPIATAVGLAHERQIVHRDIKPENMLVVEEGPSMRIKLLDFGIAKVMEKRFAGLHHTGTNTSAFTPHYGAPEQFSKTYGETGPWTDVFAMALVVLEVMRGGRRAFKGDDYMELARQSCDDTQRPTPKALKLDVPEAVEAVFLRALAVQSTLRYASMSEFWAALAGALKVGNAASMRPPPARALALTMTDPAAGQAVPKRPSRAIVFGAVVVGLGIIGTAAFVKGREPHGDPSASATSSASAAGDAPPAAATEPSATSAPTGVSLCPPTSIVIAGGRFMRGRRDGARAAAPAHAANVDAVCLDRTEVTVENFEACVKEGACARPSADKALHANAPRSDCNFAQPGRASHPMNCVSWGDANGYCRWKQMRLPREAEFEYAATRAASGTAETPWGDVADATKANLAGGDPFPKTSPVGALETGATRDGVLDLIGNVAEWQSDWSDGYSDLEVKNPTGPATGSSKVIRGGAFTGMLALNPPSSGATILSAAHREELAPTELSPAVGFRCAASIQKR